MFFSHLKHKSINDCSGLSSNFYLILTVFFSRMHGIIGSRFYLLLTFFFFFSLRWIILVNQVVYIYIYIYTSECVCVCMRETDVITNKITMLITNIAAFSRIFFCNFAQHL
ncbi:hypothetical protein HanXRQr2_Chr08g0323681 [Helianthus annuus]|uniref:Uncharacterized protein n=1 Tax=Helianthus annuus TaxID=4232 RepID=A0A9K3ICB1_HELAN|nr:hypothetical protein HanXRQr2_Chr08g0323681 [Helianthus annuus]KAJ0552349.1 hypothetical protein HanHA89_Chr08g0284281 [Helianthus annuus]